MLVKIVCYVPLIKFFRSPVFSAFHTRGFYREGNKKISQKTHIQNKVKMVQKLYCSIVEWKPLEISIKIFGCEAYSMSRLK